MHILYFLDLSHFFKNLINFVIHKLIIKMTKVILDTNFLVYCAKNKIDYVEGIYDLLNEEFEIVVPIQVIDELKNLSINKFKKISAKDKRAASLALEILESKNIKKINPKGKKADDVLIKLAKESRNIICTLDRKIRKLSKRNIVINKFKKLSLSN